jgi:hypothetical protein
MEMRSSRVAPFLLSAMLGASIIAWGTADGHCGVAVDQDSADTPAVQTPDQIDSPSSPEIPLSDQADPAPMSGSELSEEASRFDACSEDYYYCYGYDHAGQERSEEKETESIDDTADSDRDDEEYAYDDEYAYDGYGWDENADVEDATEEEEEAWAADEDDYAYDDSADVEDRAEEEVSTTADEDDCGYSYEDAYSDDAFDHGTEDVAEEASDDAEKNQFSYKYDDYYSEYGYEYEDRWTSEKSVSVDDTATDVSDVEEPESTQDDAQWDDPYAYDSGEFEEPHAYTSEYGEYGEHVAEAAGDDEAHDDFAYEEYGAWESECDESEPCQSDAGQSDCDDELEDVAADESIEQAPANSQGYSEAYPEEEFAYPEENDDEMADVDPWQDTTKEDAASNDRWEEYDYEYSYPETKYASPGAMDERIDLFTWLPGDLLLRQDEGILKILATQRDDPSGVRRATLNDYLEGLGVDAIDFTAQFENLSGIEVLGLADDVAGAAALLASFRLYDQGEVGMDEAVDVLRHALENLSNEWIEAVDEMTVEAYAEPASGSVDTDSNDGETSEWSDVSCSNNPVLGAVVSLAARSCGTVTSVIRIVSTQLAQIDTADMLKGLHQTWMAASSVSQYQ